MFSLVDEALEAELADPQAREKWLILDRHPDFPGHWVVEGFTKDYLFDLEEIIGNYRALAPSGLSTFLDAAETYGYKVAFFEDPTLPLEEYSYLNNPPEVEVKSSFPNTVKGMLPYQVQGFNMLKRLDWGVARWDTGTGKTILASALIKHHRTDQFSKPAFDFCFFVVKAHNKYNTARKLMDHVGIRATVVDGDKDKRTRIYLDASQLPYKVVLVMNYEQFKNDFVTWETITDKSGKSKKRLEGLSEWGSLFFEDTQVLMIWDEMPTKLKTRTTQLYQSICYCLYKTAPPQVKWSQLRPKSLRSYMLSATPIENSPEDWFNCLPGDTTIESLGNAHSAYKAEYKGPLVKFVTATATELTIGPNHPVLTTRGWVKAKHLNKGDYVIRRPIQWSSSTVEDFHQPPALIEDIFDALRATNERVRMKRASAFEFHGDGSYFKGEVNIVGANSFLGLEGDSYGLQESIHPKLGLSTSNTQSSLFSSGPLDFYCKRIGLPKSCLTPFHPCFLGHVRPTGTESNPHLLESGTDHLLADTLLTSDLRSGDFILQVAPFDLDKRKFNTGRVSGSHSYSSRPQTTTYGRRMNPNAVTNLAHSFTSLVTTDEIIDIELIEYSGQIYDLSSDSGTYYANGIAVSNCVRLLDGGQTYGTVTNFNNEFVASWNYFDPSKPESFHNLERMRLKSASFVHQVNKTDPDIAAVFPKAVEELVYIDWDEKNGAMYKDIQKYAKDLADSEEFEDLPVFALIGALQMMCDAPEMILDSAAMREACEEEGALRGSGVALALRRQFGERFSNVGHPKLDKLREILTERHPDSQVAIYARWNQALMPYLEAMLKNWDVSYVRYNGTNNQRQVAQDTFQAGGARVFLSSDSGSDSIDLDTGNVVIDYDLPWKWTTLTQRHNRVHRASSTHGTVYYYSLMMASSVEQRVLKVISLKQGYHNELFDPAGGDFSSSVRMSKEDLLYILTGQ